MPGSPQTRRTSRGRLSLTLLALFASSVQAAPGEPVQTAQGPLPSTEPGDAPPTRSTATPVPSAVITVQEPVPVAPPELLLPTPGGVERFDARFDDALSVKTDLLLEGVDAATQVDFTVPAEWEVLGDPVLTLDYAHSLALLPDRSHLTVTLNDQNVGSIALDAANSRGGTLTVALPHELLQPYNHLRLRAVQHYGAACEDPFDPGLWTRVRRRSAIALRYRRRPVEPDLARFPFPLFDPSGYGPAAITLVLAHAPSAATIDAVGKLGVALGRIADYRAVRLEDTVGAVREAHTNAILVGIFDETPEIRRLLGEGAPKPSQGLVALVPNPADPTRAVLVVTGGDAEGLNRAALAVASQNRHELLTGTQVKVDFVADGRPPETHRDPRTVPPAETFPVSALGAKDHTVRGFYTPTYRVPINLEGDAVVRPGGAEATIHYAYGAHLDPSLSAMEVRLDGVTLKSVALDETKGSSGSEVHVPLPDGVMKPRSTLEVAFTLFPEDFDACGYISDRTLWATVYADTTLRVARDRVAQLPDLGRLRYGTWPLTLDASGGAVIAALPDKPTPAEVGAGFLLAAQLGRWSDATVPALELVSAGAMDFAAAPDANFVLLADGTPHALYDGLVRTGALTLSNGLARTLVEGGVPALAVSAPGTDGIVEEVLQPANPDRATLVLAAPKGGDLRDLIAAVTDPARASQLSGNVAIVPPQGDARALAVGQPHQVGSFAVGAALQLAVRRNWLLLGLAMLTGALLFSRVKRAWVRGREE